MNTIVIVGGGHAAARLCVGLAERGHGARVYLVCEEPFEPYQRPPLSKGFLAGEDEAPLPHKPRSWYANAGIHLHLGDAAVAIDRAARTVKLASGTVLAYGELVLATGARPRRLPGLAEGLENVVALRGLEDALRLRSLLRPARSLTVVGGGFLGLEVASTARALGKAVRLVECAPRLLGRAASPELAAHVLAAHRAAGLEIVLGASVRAGRTDGQRLLDLEVDGRPEPIELLLVATGAEPETALAHGAGLECADGVLVDAHLRTSDPHILAIGDCARFPDPRSARPLRLECVQNALDQARTAVATLTRHPEPYAAQPWFWSDQGSALRLQMAGLPPPPETPGLRTVRRAAAAHGGFSLFHYLEDRLVCVESVNAVADHLASRKLVEAGRPPDPASAANAALPLDSP